MSNDRPRQIERAELRLARLGLISLVMLIIWVAVLAGADISRSGGGQGLFGFGFLIFLPFTIGFVLGVTAQRIWPSHTGGAGAALFAGYIFLGFSFLSGQFVICVIIALPIWLLFLVLGGLVSNFVVRKSLQEQVVAVVFLLVVSVGLWALEEQSSRPAERFTVERTVTIAAMPDQVWPHLLRMDNLGLDEGRWTASHNLMGVPRPVEAIVTGEGVGAIRIGRWRGGVWFEEHMTAWHTGRLLDWSFVFPEGSTFTSIDQHIDPRGPNVVIERGGYRIEPLANGSTRLRLYTTFSATTVINRYASWWAERILGDVQVNILAIVKSRTEASSMALVVQRSGDAPQAEPGLPSDRGGDQSLAGERLVDGRARACTEAPGDSASKSIGHAPQSHARRVAASPARGGGPQTAKVLT